MIDYKAIIENLQLDKVKNLLTELKVPFQEKEHYLLCKTMCHHTNEDGASWKLYYYKDTHIFYCYTECQSMSIFKFLKNYYDTREIEYDWYNDIYKVIINCSLEQQLNNYTTTRYNSDRDKYIKQKQRKELQEYPHSLLNIFIKKYPVEWLQDNISKEAMDKFNILYSISQNKIIIPHYDINNRLIGIRGRSLNEWEIENLGKYMPVQIEQKWYSHPLGLNLYGLNITKNNIEKTGICYLFEAEKSVMQMESFSIPNCAVAVCGSAVNKYQIDLLLRYCYPKEIVLCFDNEEKNNEDKYFMKLYNICKKYNKYCNFSFIYDREKISKIKDSPSDNGEEIFKKLLKGRVRV